MDIFLLFVIASILFVVGIVAAFRAYFDVKISRRR